LDSDGVRIGSGNVEVDSNQRRRTGSDIEELHGRSTRREGPGDRFTSTGGIAPKSVDDAHPAGENLPRDNRGCERPFLGGGVTVSER